MNKRQNYVKTIFAAMLVIAMSVGGVTPALAYNGSSSNGMYGLFNYTKEGNSETYHLYIRGDDGMEIDCGEVSVDQDSVEALKKDEYYPSNEEVDSLFKKYNVSKDYHYERVSINTDSKVITINVHKTCTVFWNLTEDKEFVSAPDENEYTFVREETKNNGDVYKYYVFDVVKNNVDDGSEYSEDLMNCGEYKLKYITTDENGVIYRYWHRVKVKFVDLATNRQIYNKEFTYNEAIKNKNVEGYKFAYTSESGENGYDLIFYYKKSFNIGWATKDGSRCYYTTDNGDLATGWKKIDNTWYYFNKDGIMQTGWLHDNGWYYLKDGKAVNGWCKVDGTWYLFNDSCKMLTGWVKDNGTWYYLKGSGAMATGWTEVGGEWYFLADSGAMKTGWLKDGGTWFYLLDSGIMAKSRWVGNYYFYSNGAMAVNTWIGRYHVNWNGQWDRTW